MTHAKSSVPRDVYSIYLGVELVERADALAATRHRASRSMLIDLALEEYLDRNESEDVKQARKARNASAGD